MRKKKFLWSWTDGVRLEPYAILIAEAEIAEEIMERRDYESKWSYLAELLHNKYPFPPWRNEYGMRNRNIFWFNNVLEEWEEAYERLIEEEKKKLREYYEEGQEEALEDEAKLIVDAKLKDLPVYEV
jgi:hypothetical protein